MILFSRILFLLAFLFTSPILRADVLADGWEAFIDNRFEDAEDRFISATGSADSAISAEAYLGLSMIHQLGPDEDKAVEAFQQFFRLCPSPGPYVEALWLTNSVSGGLGKKTEDRIALLEEIADRKDLDGKLISFANGMLGRHYELSHETEKSLNYRSGIGSLTAWSLLGAFENISASGFRKDHGVLDHPDKGYVFSGKNEIPIRWFDLDVYRPGEWIDFEYHFYIDNSIIYAQTFCYSGEAREVQLRVGTSGSLKTWVNDQLVIEEPEERNNNLDTYISTVRLTRGWNRILIQVGNSYLGRSNFMVRITDRRGIPLDSLTYDTEVHEYPKYGQPVKSHEGSETERYFEEMIDAEPGKVLHYLLLLDLYLSNDKKTKAWSIVNQLNDLAPDCLYSLSKMYELYLRDDNDLESGSTVERIKEVCPDSWLALNLRYSEYLETENYDKAREVHRQLTELSGKDDETRIREINFLALDNKIEELKTELEEAYSLYPDNWVLANLKFVVLRDLDHKPGEAVAFLESFLERNWFPILVETLAAEYFKQDRVEEGIGMYEQYLDTQPYSTGYATTLAEVYYRLGQYEKAEVLYRSAIAMAPGIGRVYKGLGLMKEDIGETGEAITLYEKCLTYSPTEYEIHDKLRRLKEQVPLSDYFEEVDLYSLIDESGSATDYPEDNSLIVADIVNHIVYPGGASKEKHHICVKVFNGSGIDEWKEYEIYNDWYQQVQIEKAEVVKANGKRINAETSGDYIVFTGLEAGDALLLVYELTSFYNGVLSQHFWTDHYFDLFYPVYRSQYHLIVPSDLNFQYRVTVEDIEPAIEMLDGYKRFSWKMENTQSVPYEPLMPNLPDVARVLYLSSIPDWEFVSDWYSDLSESKTEADAEIKALTRGVLGDSPSEYSPEEKARKIYNYITDNIRYSYVSFRQSSHIPQRARDVALSKIGDCKDLSTLFVAMCKAAGLDASLILVNTRDNGVKCMPLPSIDFNHCIARLDLEKEHYLELTYNTLPFSCMTNKLEGALVLDIDHDEGEEVELMTLRNTPDVPNSIVRDVRITFDENAMLVETDNIKTGLYAADMRDTYQDIGEKERRETMTRAISEGEQRIELVSLEFGPSLLDQVDSFAYRFSYRQENPFSPIGSMKVFPVPLPDKEILASYLGEDERRFPVEYWMYESMDQCVNRVDITLPKGMSLVEIPEDVTAECGVASYRLTFKEKEGKVWIERRFLKHKDVVTPEEYPSFKAFLEEVMQSDNQQLAIR